MSGSGRRGRRRLKGEAALRNKYCSYEALHNEADVEQCFVRRMLEDFGYSDREIRPKESLRALTVGGLRGQQQALYRPDFALVVEGAVRCLIEAKEPDADLDQHEWQVRAYAVLLNGERPENRPVRHYILTNATQTRVYHIDRNRPLFTLQFTSFQDGTSRFDETRGLLSRDAIAFVPQVSPRTIEMERPTIATVNAAFAWCHQHIYKKDNISQSDAFSEFVKLISLKLLSDRRIRDNHPEALEQERFQVASAEVRFSSGWIEANQANSANPISDILFRQFMDDMERDIAHGRRKRIFREEDRIALRPETIEGVVKKLERLFLFGIDADLNGRLFETFLNATMRGKDLGQFFTPRSVVKLGVGLAQFKVDALIDNARHTDMVLDACCGTGGFLIDVLADMWGRVDRRRDLAQDAKLALKQRIANEAIVGVDVANAPILARIARLNMYLHGDGGTRIYHLNALDPDLPDADTDSLETINEKNELRRLFSEQSFDVVLTNPPFAKELDRQTGEERRILASYEVGRNRELGGASVRSVLIFLERYYQLLRPGGRMVTIIDDGILGGDEYRSFRAKLREWFLVIGVVSLPGDAFQRSNARVKTSYVILEKRGNVHQNNPPIFMYPCQHVGNDDPKRQRARAGDAQLRALATQEINDVSEAFAAFKAGNGDNQYIVSSDRVLDRLDVKNCLVEAGSQLDRWHILGLLTRSLSDLVCERVYTPEAVITRDSGELVTVLIVRYDGTAQAGDEMNASDSSYARLYPVNTGDIVISNIAASHGSIAVVPARLDGCVVSNEYTVLRARESVSPTVMQIILRSPEIRAEILLSSSGANRTRTRWDLLKDIQVPYPREDEVTAVDRISRISEKAQRTADRLAMRGVDDVEVALGLRSAEADRILAAFKPPK